ncbi:MAG: 4Fe-4S dicluster domain-containing protein, partial [Clostridia bacterium]|nr:4Fe-4S dicluster domain-containing protein [Clostridia bacterium]
YFLLREHLQDVLAGAKALKAEGGYKEIVLSVEKKKANLLSLAHDQILDGVRICVLPDVYPMGDEIGLIYQSTGRIVPPGQLPISAGVVVQNVETVLNAGRVLLSGKPVLDKWLTVCGDVPTPYTLRVPVGTPIKALFAHLGIEIKETQIVLDGGPAMGKRIDENTAVVRKATKAITVLPKTCHAARKVLASPSVAYGIASTACCQCTRCTDLCPRNLLGYPLEPHRFVRAHIKGGTIDPVLLQNALLCCGCGVCETVACCQGISPKTVIDGYKNELRLKGIRFSPKANETYKADKARDYRMVPAHRMAALLGIAKLDRLPQRAEYFAPKTVRVPLAGHIGAPSVATIREGDSVKRGELIATAAEGLSVAQHTPVCGKVRAVTSQEIVIEREE